VLAPRIIAPLDRTPLPEPTTIELRRGTRGQLARLAWWSVAALPRNPSHRCALLGGALVSFLVAAAFRLTPPWLLFSTSIGVLAVLAFLCALQTAPWHAVIRSEGGRVYMSKHASIAIAPVMYEGRRAWQIRHHVARKKGGFGAELRTRVATAICPLADEYGMAIIATAVNQRVLERYLSTLQEFGVETMPGTSRGVIRRAREASTE